MKGHKGHHHTVEKIEHHIAKHHRKSGGGVGLGGVDEEAEDMRQKPERRDNARKVDDEAEALHAKRGGRAKRKAGGHVTHKHTGHVKHVGAVHGEHASHHAGRKPRKAGGSVESNPFSFADKGVAPGDHKVERKTMGKD